MEAKRVLLAEDEPNIVESLRFLLARAGFDVSVCESGRAALEAALERPPDLLILDVMMPEMDGFEVLRQLRRTHPAATLPVIMLTAKGQREDREKALARGANAFISKPFSNADLLDAVRGLSACQTA